MLDRNVFLLLFPALEESFTIKIQINVNVLHQSHSGMAWIVYLVLQDKTGTHFLSNVRHVQLNKDGIKPPNHALDVQWVQFLIPRQNLASNQILLVLEAKFTTQIPAFANVLPHNHIGMVLLVYHVLTVNIGVWQKVNVLNVLQTTFGIKSQENASHALRELRWTSSCKSVKLPLWLVREAKPIQL